MLCVCVRFSHLLQQRSMDSLVESTLSLGWRVASKPVRMYIAMLRRIGQGIVEWVEGHIPDDADRYARNARQFLETGVTYGVIGSTLLFAATFLYLAFYCLYIPTYSMVSPAYLQFDADRTAPARCIVDLELHQTLLKPHQPYDMYVTLELPESPANRAAGMFMVGAKLSSRVSNETFESTRPDVLRYRSPLLSWLHTLFWSPLFVLGYSVEKQTHVVSMFEQFVSTSSIGRVDRAEIWISKPDLEVYSVAIRVDAHFSGLRYWMYWWPITTAVLLIGCICFWESVACLYIRHKYFSSHEHHQHHSVHDGDRVRTRVLRSGGHRGLDDDSHARRPIHTDPDRYWANLAEQMDAAARDDGGSSGSLGPPSDVDATADTGLGPDDMRLTDTESSFGGDIVAEHRRGGRAAQRRRQESETEVQQQEQEEEQEVKAEVAGGGDGDEIDEPVPAADVKPVTHSSLRMRAVKTEDEP